MKHFNQLTKVAQAVATEAIHFQKPDFFRDLVAVISPYITGQAQLPSRNQRAEIAAKVSSVIKKYTNLTVKGVWGYGYAIGTPDWFRDHILIESQKHFSNEEDAIASLEKSRSNSIKGSVDLERGWVEGFYAEQPFYLYLSLDEFASPEMKAEHHAASILHEVGHAVGMCEMIDRVVDTNQVLSRMQRELIDADPVKRVTIIKKAGKDLQLNEKTIDSASNSSNTEVVTTILLTGLLQDRVRNTKSPYYSISTAEQMADEFAARHGAGAWLVDNLDRLGLDGADVQKRSNAAFYTIEFVKTAYSIVSIFSLPLFLVALLWVRSDSADSGGVYDTPHDRFKRIRNQIIQGMKSYGTSKERYEAYKQQLEMLDSVLVQYTNRQQWWGTVYDYLFNYKGVKDKDFQQELEALASNELFSGAQALKHL